jgi:peptidoglycan/LPS O-acetylase OafA/YrhL
MPGIKTSLQNESKTDHLILLTVLRGAFAWWVVSFHIREWLPKTGEFSSLLLTIFEQGYLGVDFFFVLSGFVIGRRYLAEFESLTKKRILKFLYLRFARVYPLHLLLLMCMVADPIMQLYFAKARTISDQYPMGYFAQSLFLVQNWGLETDLRWNVPAWSISTEFLAYLVFPFIAFGLMQIKRNSVMVPSILIVILLAKLAIIFNFLGYQSLGDNVTKMGAIRCLTEFAIGCCLAQIMRIVSIGRGSNRVLTLLLFSVSIASIFIGLSFSWKNYFFVPIAVATGILAVAIFEQHTRVRVPKLLIAIGDYSYSTYLSHWIIKGWFIFANIHLLGNRYTLILLYTLSVLVASWLLYKFVELPSQNWLRRNSPFNR